MHKVKRPKVSVCLVTYNQCKYIRQCLQSIIDQKTDFYFDVIVGEDCSEDGTREIVQEFATLYPEVIKPIFQEKNTGGRKNYLDVYKRATGEYIAHMDGDDFMLPGKLQTMVNCLKEKPGVAAAVHKLEVVNKEGCFAGWIWPQRAPHIIGLEYMLKNHPVFGHSSLMYRRGVIEWTGFGSFDFIDFYIYLLIGQKGDIVFIDEILGCYRENVGISTNFDKFLPHIEFVFCEAEKFGVPKEIVKQARAYHFYKTSIIKLFLELSPDDFRKYIELSFHQSVIGLPQCLLFLLRRRPQLLYGLHKHYKYLKNRGLVWHSGVQKILNIPVSAPCQRPPRSIEK